MEEESDTLGLSCTCVPEEPTSGNPKSKPHQGTTKPSKSKWVSERSGARPWRAVGHGSEIHGCGVPKKQSSDLLSGAWFWRRADRQCHAFFSFSRSLSSCSRCLTWLTCSICCWSWDLLSQLSCICVRVEKSNKPISYCKRQCDTELVASRSTQADSSTTRSWSTIKILVCTISQLDNLNNDANEQQFIL